MAIERAELCRLYGWTIHTYKGQVRYGHLPIEDPPGGGWRSFTALETTKIMMTLDFVESFNMSRGAAADFVRGTSELINERWREIVDSGRDLFEGRATDEFLLVRLHHPMAITSGRRGVRWSDSNIEKLTFGDPTVECLPQSELGDFLEAINQPIVRIAASNVSRSVCRVMIKAQHEDIEIDWRNE